MKIRDFGIAAVISILVAALGSPAFSEDAPEPIFGQKIMTEQERDQYKKRIREAESADARERIRAEHRERMQARAKERGVSLPDVAAPGNGPRVDVPNEGRPQVRGRDLMTDEERAHQREQMRSATSEEERKRIRSEQHERMEKRAEEQGVTLPDEPQSRGRGMGEGRGRDGSGGRGGRR